MEKLYWVLAWKEGKEMDRTMIQLPTGKVQDKGLDHYIERIFSEYNYTQLMVVAIDKGVPYEKTMEEINSIRNVIRVASK